VRHCRTNYREVLKVDEKIAARKFKIIMEMEAKNDKLL